MKDIRGRLGSTSALVLPLVLLVLLVGVVPVLYAFAQSFSHDLYGQRSPAGVDNYRRVFTDRSLVLSANITVLWSLLTTALGIASGLSLGVRLVRAGPRFSKALYYTLLVPWAVPVYIGAPVWRALLYGHAGRSVFSLATGLTVDLMVDPAAAFVATAAVQVWFTVPLTAFVCCGRLAAVPAAALEAARLEGAGELRLFRSILFPAVRGTVMILSLLGFLRGVREFSVIFLMTRGGPPLLAGIGEGAIVGATTTIGIYLFDLLTGNPDLGLSSAYSVVTAAAVGMLTLLWLLLRGSRSRRREVVAVVALAQIPFAWPAGAVIAAAYLVGLLHRRVLLVVGLLHGAYIVVRIVQHGFIAGITPGAAVALVACLSPAVRGERDRRGGPGPEEQLAAGGGAKGRISAGVGAVLWRGLSLAAAPAAVLSTILVLYVLLWLSVSAVGTTYIDGVVPRHFSLRSYVDAIRDERILYYFANTLFVGAVAAVAAPAVILPAAYALSRARPRVRNGAFVLVQAIAVFGGMHMLVPLYVLFLRLGLIDTYVPLVVIYAHHAVPVGLLVMTDHLLHIPPSLEEAARIEGAGTVDFIRRILIPASMPVILVTAALALLGVWNGFLAPLLFLNDDGKYTIGVKLYSLVGTFAAARPRWNLFAAASVLNVAVIALVFTPLRTRLRVSVLEEVEE